MPDNVVRSTTVFRPFAGKRRKFRLGIAEIGELEQARGVGLCRLMVKLTTLDCGRDDIADAIRLGLRGGGMTDWEADALIEHTLTDEVPVGTCLQVACDVVTAAFYGMEADNVKRGKWEGEPTKGSPETSIHSTESERQSDSLHARSMQ